MLIARMIICENGTLRLWSCSAEKELLVAHDACYVTAFRPCVSVFSMVYQCRGREACFAILFPRVLRLSPCRYNFKSGDQQKKVGVLSGEGRLAPLQAMTAAPCIVLHAIRAWQGNFRTRCTRNRRTGRQGCLHELVARLASAL